MKAPTSISPEVLSTPAETATPPKKMLGEFPEIAADIGDMVSGYWPVGALASIATTGW